MKTIDVLAIGMVTIDSINVVDRYPNEGTTSPVRRSMTALGGQMGRAALSCARLGAKTTLAGMIGQGAFADLLRAELAREPIDAKLLPPETESPSQHSIVVLSGDVGERTILWTPQPRATSTCLELCAQLIPQARCVLLDGTDIGLAVASANLCREHSVPSVIDTGSYNPEADKILGLVDYIISPEKYFRARANAGAISYHDAIRAVLQRFAPALVVSTEGERGGAYAEMADLWRIRRYDPVPVKAVDSCGAGDVFHGGFAYALARGWPIPKALDFSAWLAAQKCTQLANGGLPDVGQIPSSFA